MDLKTFEGFAAFAVTGTRNKSEQLSLLTEEESKLFNQLKFLVKNRLEQEKISQEYVNSCIKSAIES